MTVGPQPRRSREDATKLLKTCLGPLGSVIPTRHFQDELANEHVALLDAFHVLKRGCIYEEPELDVATSDWKYRIEGEEPDGKWLKIVFCFKSETRMVLITVFS